MGNELQEIVEKGFAPDRSERFRQSAEGLPQPCAKPARKNDDFHLICPGLYPADMCVRPLLKCEMKCNP